MYMATKAVCKRPPSVSPIFKSHWIWVKIPVQNKNKHNIRDENRVVQTVYVAMHFNRMGTGLVI